jgi:hypothetical protein
MWISSFTHQEIAGPAQLGKLGIMCMEHVQTGEFVAEFQNAALRLSLHDRICELGRGHAGASWIVLEKVRMQMERIYQVILQDVYQVYANLLAYFDWDWVLLKVERYCVDGIEIINVVEIDVKAVHYHHELMINQRSASRRIYDKSAI